MTEKSDAEFEQARRFVEIGAICYDRHETAAARSNFYSAAVLDPGSDAAQYGLAAILLRQGKLSSAVVAFRRAFRKRDDVASYGNLLAVALIRNGQAGPEALAGVTRALALRPDFADALANLGLLRMTGGEPELAERAFKTALCCDPAQLDALNNLGLLYGAGNDGVAVLACFQRCLVANPASGRPSINLGAALQLRMRLGESHHHFRRAIILAPGDTTPYNNLAALQLERGEADEARTLFDRAVILAPGHTYARMNQLFARLYVSGTSLPEFLTKARAVAATLPSAPAPARARRSTGLPRIGFVSADFRRHAVGYLAIPTVEALAAKGHAIYCYAHSSGADSMTRRFLDVSTWRDIRTLSDEQAAALIRQDEIDILFDLGGYSASNRLSLFRHRPAPAQIAWLGYPGTTGLPEMDFILADPWQIPLGAEGCYSEKVIRLPRSYVVYEPPANMPEAGEPPAVERGYVTFGSFNVLKKISPAVIACWADLLRRMETARLVVKSPVLEDPDTRDMIKTAFARSGVSADRLTLAGASNSEDHQRMMQTVDIALDPFPYTGGLTTLDCLWMGVPTVTLPGETFSSRHTFGYLSQLGLDHLVASDPADYLDRLCRLAADLSALIQLRRTLRQRMIESPLCDREGFGDLLSETLARIAGNGFA